MRGYRFNHKIKCWVFVFLAFILLECYLNAVYYKILYFDFNRRAYNPNMTSTTITEGIVFGDKFRSFSDFCFNITVMNATDEPTNVAEERPIIVYYKYPLINSTYVSMEYKNGYNSSYYWFQKTKPFFKKIGDENISKCMPICKVNQSSLGPIKVNKTKRDLEWVEQQNVDVKLGGCYAPAHCRAKHRVAIIVPYRNRRTNLIIFLHYIHPLLKKQSINYRIFVIEQYGKEKFNKGSLYNIAFLESQRFGTWHCLIFHDVDLIPEDERISYSCPEQPTHMSPAVDIWGYVLPYNGIFGGVTALTPAQYEAVNGYSNCYWNWGGEDDDMLHRIISTNYTMSRYNGSIARYATLSHPRNEYGNQRKLLLMLSRLRYLKEGLVTTKYKLIKVTNEKLYTHILADVNPMKMKLDTKSLMKYIVKLYGKYIEYGRKDLQLKSISAKELRIQLQRERESEMLKHGINYTETTTEETREY